MFYFFHADSSRSDPVMPRRLNGAAVFHFVAHSTFKFDMLGKQLRAQTISRT